MGSIMNTLPLPRRLPIALGLFLVPACGSDSMAPSGGGPAISVAVVPATASLLTSGSQDFTATVANDPSNSGVTWSITGCSGGPAACGSLSRITTTQATYTAPPTVPPGGPGVTATSVADPTKAITATVAVAATSTGREIAFFRSDSIYAIYVMNAAGTGVTRVTVVDDHEWLLYAEPVWSPDGSKIVFYDGSSKGGDDDIYVVNADGSGRRNLTNNQAQDVQPAWSPDGTKIAFSSWSTGGIYVMNPDGSGLRNLTNNAGDNFTPAWSPDGTKILFGSTRDGNYAIYLMNADGSGVTRLTDPEGIWGEPAWSPGGTKIAFASSRDGNRDVYMMNADGTGVTRLTNDPGSSAYNPVWSPDGSKIAFWRYCSYCTGNGEIYVMNGDGSGLLNLTNNPAFDERPRWSPDGTQIAFSSDRDGNTEIYVINVDGSGLRNLTNNPAIDIAPAWRPR